MPDLLLHRAQVAGLVFQVADDRSRDLRRQTRFAREDQKQMILQRLDPLAWENHRPHLVRAVAVERDVVEAAERRRDLILQPHRLAQHAVLDVNRLARERVLGNVPAAERVKRVDEADGKC